MGLDIGSTASKGVILKNGEDIVALKQYPLVLGLLDHQEF
ncbi:hypothetical protein QGK_0410 [Clostridioides difficile CD206]|nr:hypothetical protein QGK_0410 [Clostridioides difficile CD206]